MSFAERRKRLLEQLDQPLVLFSGGTISRNYPANYFPFRADSSFLYFFERPEPNSAALFDKSKGVILYLPERTLDDALWHGESESFADAKARHGVDEVRAIEGLEKDVSKPHALAVADARTTARARKLSGLDLDFDTPLQVGPAPVIDAISKLRLKKDDRELKAMRETARITQAAHVEAMKGSTPGVSEQELVGVVEGIFTCVGCVPAYGTILTARGEVLHHHGHENTLQAGDVVLCDAGCEAPSGYCSDVTRCWPVGGPFTPEGRDVYDTVLKANEAAIAAVKPGARYRDLHLLSARVVAEGLKAMGLITCDVETALETGAHALFFPHGVGHQLGLDVHDLETFGDRILYPGGRTRSPQFGTKYLRMDMDLEAGMTFTIEPGIYFVPAILRDAALRKQHAQAVDFERAERFLAMNGGRGFGGVRIEDDVLCTTAGAEVLTAAVPKGREEVEKLAMTNL